MSRLLPDDVREAIASHLEEAHGISEFDPAEVGRSTARHDLVRVTWTKPSADEGAVFRCLRCPAGYDRYHVEVYQPVPTSRMVTLIRDHFRDAHGDHDLTVAEIHHAENLVDEPAAVFMPMTPMSGASIICQRCPDGANKITLAAPPYGDARRLHDLPRWQPTLWQQITGLTMEQQAEWLEAWDRGDLQRRQHRIAVQALQQARQPQHPSGQGPLERALTTHMARRVAAGERITRVINDLAGQAQRGGDAFTITIGHALPGVAEHTDRLQPSEIRDRTVRFLGLPDGVPPYISERKLWTLWGTANAPRR